MSRTRLCSSTGVPIRVKVTPGFQQPDSSTAPTTPPSSRKLTLPYTCNGESGDGSRGNSSSSLAKKYRSMQ
ncbi:hypothetical protein D3C78_1177010 [compost metagenome]